MTAGLFAVKSKLPRYQLAVTGVNLDDIPGRVEFKTVPAEDGPYVMAKDVQNIARLIFDALESGDVRLARGLVQGLR